MPPKTKWFHDDRPAIWSQLSKEIGARYTDGTWRKAARIQVDHGEWTVTLDTYTIVVNNIPIAFTRYRAPFRVERAFRMHLSRTNFFTPLAKFFGLQDVEIGDAEFDAAFVIKSNDASAVREFFGDAALRAAILREPSLQMSVEDDEGWFGSKFPPHADELRFVISGHEKDPERLKRLFDLFTDALDRLWKIGAASPRSPGVEL